MSEFWNKKINEIEPYVAGEQPKKGEKVIKLNTNENPYPPTPMARVILRTCDVAELRLYPNASSTELLEAVAEKEGVKPSQVFAGNGSDEVLALCFQTFFEKENETALPVLTPEFSYSFYPVFAKFYDVRTIKIPLKEDFRLDPDDYIGTPNCGIVIANPNAPTSRSMYFASRSSKMRLDADCWLISSASPSSLEETVTLSLSPPSSAILLNAKVNFSSMRAPII